jgi:acetyltransferase-like isoleucine patch superfamily enzyme
MSPPVPPAEGAIIGLFVAIDHDTNIEDGTRIGAWSEIGACVRIGRSCTIGQRVWILSGATIDDACTIHDGAMIGRDVHLETGVQVGAFANICPNAVVASRLEIPDRARIRHDYDGSPRLVAIGRCDPSFPPDTFLCRWELADGRVTTNVCSATFWFRDIAQARSYMPGRFEDHVIEACLGGAAV